MSHVLGHHCPQYRTLSHGRRSRKRRHTPSADRVGALRTAIAERTYDLDARIEAVIDILFRAMNRRAWGEPG